MKDIHRDKYVIYGMVNGKIADTTHLVTLEQIEEYVKSLGFGTRGKFKFEDETRKKEVVGYIDNLETGQTEPVFEETLIGIYPSVEFHRGSTMLNVMKFRYYSPFSGLLEEDEYLYFIDDKDLNLNEKILYLISDKDRVFKLNTNTSKITELKIEVEKDRVEIMKHKYKIEYLRNHKLDRYKF